MRRNRLMTIMAAGLLALASSLAGAAHAGEDGRQQVVYHVADPEKVAFALGNIRNHIEGMGGPEKVEIVLVVHGPGLKAFQELQAEPRVKEGVAALREDGVEFEACGNTLKALGVELFDLLPGFEKVDQGGVVRIAQLQEKGYIYIRP